MSDDSDALFTPPQERNSGAMFSFDYSSFLGASSTAEAMEEDTPQYREPQKLYDDRRPAPFIKQEAKHLRSECFTYTAPPAFTKPVRSASPATKPLSKKRSLDPVELQPSVQERIKLPQLNVLDDQSTFLHQPCIIKTEKPVPVYEAPQISTIELVVERQPPVEVRTRTPSENRYSHYPYCFFIFANGISQRNFGVTVRVAGDYEHLDIERVEVRLCYAIGGDSDVKQSILGGKKVVIVQEDGRAVFDNLSMCEASTKHGEREFCLEFVPLTSDGKALEDLSAKTNAFYAYSHMKVLTRRSTSYIFSSTHVLIFLIIVESVKLRTLSKNAGRTSGGEEMHVVGQPFIRGPSLKVVFRTPHGDVTAPKLEIYSDSVLFFESPPYPNAGVLSAYAGKVSHFFTPFFKFIWFRFLLSSFL